MSDGEMVLTPEQRAELSELLRQAAEDHAAFVDERGGSELVDGSWRQEPEYTRIWRWIARLTGDEAEAQAATEIRWEDVRGKAFLAAQQRGLTLNVASEAGRVAADAWLAQKPATERGGGDDER